MDKAAAEEREFVRRGTIEPALMRRYASQGFELVHSVQRKVNLVYLMARRATQLPELQAMFAAGSAALVS
ncbi:MAG: hypothetical protein ACJ786_14925 [Catenulispora sp.]